MNVNVPGFTVFCGCVPMCKSLKLARGGLSERRALPPTCVRATETVALLLLLPCELPSDVASCLPSVLNVRLVVALLLTLRKAYGLAVAAAPFEYILYKEVGVAAPGELSADINPPTFKMDATSSAQK